MGYVDAFYLSDPHNVTLFYSND